MALCFVNLTKGELVVSNLGDSHVILAERDPQTEQPYHIVCRAPVPALDGAQWVITAAPASSYHSPQAGASQ